MGAAAAGWQGSGTIGPMHNIPLGGRYTPLHLLGSGGMAKVYLVHDELLGREVALKILREQYAKDEEFAQRFRREAQSAAYLNHPNIVQVYDYGEGENGPSYIAMEYVSGGTLGDRLRRDGPLGGAEAARLASHVAEALGFAHGRGVIHRDVKPQNVLLTAAGAAKVADFGIARVDSTSAISRTSVVLGTAAYISPEQAMGEPVGPASDLYSLGIVLYEMLTGSVPFEAETPVGVAMRHVHESPRPAKEMNLDVPEGMDALVMRLLAKKPEDRYRSAFELVQDLRRAQEGLPPSFVGAAEGSETVRVPSPLAAPASSSSSVFGRRGYARRKFPWAMAATLAALFALLGVLGWGLSQPPERVGTVSALEGGSLSAPETSSGTGRDDGGRGASSDVPSASPAGGASAASASASVAASAPTSASPPVQRAFPAPGGQDGGSRDPGGGGSAAQDEYQ
jgi:eukaryotic-like serine/threonine-protein kinase